MRLRGSSQWDADNHVLDKLIELAGILRAIVLIIQIRVEIADRRTIPNMRHSKPSALINVFIGFAKPANLQWPSLNAISGVGLWIYSRDMVKNSG